MKTWKITQFISHPKLTTNLTIVACGPRNQWLYGGIYCLSTFHYYDLFSIWIFPVLSNHLLDNIKLVKWSIFICTEPCSFFGVFVFHTGSCFVLVYICISGVDKCHILGRLHLDIINVSWMIMHEIVARSHMWRIASKQYQCRKFQRKFSHKCLKLFLLCFLFPDIVALLWPRVSYMCNDDAYTIVIINYILLSYLWSFIIYYRFIVRFPIGLDFLFTTFTLLLHFLLSWTSSLSISSSAISASTLSNHVFLGLPTGLLPSTLNSIYFFNQSSSHVHTISVYHF